MNCPKCGGDTRVVESRPREDGVWRRRKCAKAHLSYTLETPTAEPIRKVRKKREVPVAKRAEIPYSPAVEEWSLNVTASSPLWLKSMAMKLG